MPKKHERGLVFFHFLSYLCIIRQMKKFLEKSRKPILLAPLFCIAFFVLINLVSRLIFRVEWLVNILLWIAPIIVLMSFILMFLEIFSKHGNMKQIFWLGICNVFYILLLFAITAQIQYTDFGMFG